MYKLKCVKFDICFSQHLLCLALSCLQNVLSHFLTFLTQNCVNSSLFIGVRKVGYPGAALHTASCDCLGS